MDAPASAQAVQQASSSTTAPSQAGPAEGHGKVGLVKKKSTSKKKKKEGADTSWKKRVYAASTLQQLAFIPRFLYHGVVSVPRRVPPIQVP